MQRRTFLKAAGVAGIVAAGRAPSCRTRFRASKPQGSGALGR